MYVRRVMRSLQDTFKPLLYKSLEIFQSKRIYSVTILYAIFLQNPQKPTRNSLHKNK